MRSHFLIQSSLSLTLSFFILGCGTGLDVSELASTNADSSEKTNSYKISTYNETMCVIGRQGYLKCYGSGTNNRHLNPSTSNIGDDAGEMGDNLNAIDLGTGKKAISVAVGSQTTCVALDDNTVKCAGNNGWGGLGRTYAGVYGSSASHYGDAWPKVELGSNFKVVKVYAGELHNCALSDEGKAKCWGSNHQGVLGLGVSTGYVGTNDIQMGDNLGFVNVGTNRTIKDMSLGGSHSCALLDNNTVKCWGRGSQHGTGSESTVDIGDSASEMGDNLPIVNLGTGRTAKKLFVHRSTTCVVMDNNAIKCWGGNNDWGGLGQGHTTYIGGNAGDMGDNLASVDIGTGVSAKLVATTGNSTCSVATDNTVRCWGGSGYGNLGISGSSNIGDGSGEMGDNLFSFHLGSNEKIIDITMTNYSACASLDGYKLKCWGADNQGILGKGTTNTHLGDNNFELGDYLQAVDLGTNF